MKSLRVHLCEAMPNAPVPYLLLGKTVDDSVEFDFGPLEVEPTHRIPNLSISVSALYDVIQGQLLRLSRREGTITLCQDGEELIIDCAESDGTRRRRYRVWLSEIALGWNLLCGHNPRSCYLA